MTNTPYVYRLTDRVNGKRYIGSRYAKVRGTTNGERLLHFVESPAYAAKNRYNCPDEIEMTIENLSKLLPLAN